VTVPTPVRGFWKVSFKIYSYLDIFNFRRDMLEQPKDTYAEMSTCIIFSVKSNPLNFVPSGTACALLDAWMESQSARQE